MTPDTTYIHVMKLSSGVLIGVKEDMTHDVLTPEQYQIEVAKHSSAKTTTAKPRAVRTKKPVAVLAPPAFPKDTAVKTADGKSAGITTGAYTGEFTRVVIRGTSGKTTETWMLTSSLVRALPEDLESPKKLAEIHEVQRQLSETEIRNKACNLVQIGKVTEATELLKQLTPPTVNATNGGK